MSVFQAVFWVVNYVINSPLTGRLYSALCDDMEAEHTALLYNRETWWVSHNTKMLLTDYELKEKIEIFLSDSNNNDDANLCYNEDFIQKLAYMVDIFKNICNVNKSMMSLKLILTQEWKSLHIHEKVGTVEKKYVTFLTCLLLLQDITPEMKW